MCVCVHVRRWRVVVGVRVGGTCACSKLAAAYALHQRVVFREGWHNRRRRPCRHSMQGGRTRAMMTTTLEKMPTHR